MLKEKNQNDNVGLWHSAPYTQPGINRAAYRSRVPEARTGGEKIPTEHASGPNGRGKSRESALHDAGAPVSFQ
ncbi:MAG: hypothetical protein E2O84_07810 [Bacteroidetes bacterium]|nr:MAG: hypothetical protein E2O84_07810 [Bacteroidota bacterium]